MKYSRLVLEIRITLEQNGTDSRLDKLSLVKRRCNYRDPRNKICLGQANTLFRPGPASCSLWWRWQFSQGWAVHAASTGIQRFGYRDGPARGWLCCAVRA